MENDLLQNNLIQFEFSIEEKELYNLLNKRDGQLSLMYEGIIRTLKYTENPMRLSQAANTIRELVNRLIEYNGVKYINATPLISEEEISPLENIFEQALKKTISNIYDNDERQDALDNIKQAHEKLKKSLIYGSRIKRQQMLALVGDSSKIKSMPETIQLYTNKLAKTFRYFDEVTHNKQVVESEFNGKWVFFQQFIRLINLDFFDATKEIDQFLQ